MKTLLTSVTFLALCLCSSLLVASPLPDKPHVYVEGSAELDVAPDVMTFTLLLETIDIDLAKAKADVDTRSVLLIDTCKKLGLKPDAIATTALSISPQYDYKDQGRVFSGNHVSRQVDITLKDLSKYPQIMKAFVDAKISQTVDTKLSVSDIKGLTDKTLMAAMTDARSRAERLAKAEGKTLGEPFSISEFNTRENERYTLQVSRAIVGKSAAEAFSSAKISEPFEPGVMKAKAQVYVVYLLK